MQVSDARLRLNALLDDAGFDVQNPDPNLAWRAFKAFVQEPVDCADDGVLFECGVFNFTGTDLFHLKFVRQFSIADEEGEHDHMEQLHCAFTREPTEELAGLQKNLWAYTFSTLDGYFSAVENLDEFRVAVSYPAWACEIRQWKI